MSASRAILLLVGVLASVNGAAVELTGDNFDGLTAGKNSFLKFFAPWCGHCKAMKPAWDALGDEFADSTSVVIGDVDCTTDRGKILCEKHDVKGYPTIKYFNGDTGEKGEKYSGGRDKETLVKFVQESLSKKCEIADPASCSEKEVGFIEKMKGDTAEAAKQLERLKGMKGNSMAPDLKKWLNQRIAILTQIVA